MKFCPNCGYSLDNKKVCECGYNVETNEVDDKFNKMYKENEKHCDNIPSDVINGMRMMGVDSNVTDEDIIKSINGPIFNKENDNIIDSSEFLKIIDRRKDTQENDK